VPATLARPEARNTFASFGDLTLVSPAPTIFRQQKQGMTMHTFKVTARIPATAREVYDSWLDGERHARMTGGAATGYPTEGSTFTAWDGYISGRNLELVDGERILQSWRTTEFGEDDASSRIEITLRDVDGECEITLKHSGIPEDQPDYEQGWADHYFEPMASYFSSL
jgi:activator of HSP90 ATPase